jgi:putative redox protein
VKVLARRIEGYSNELQLEGRHELLVDEPAEKGGADAGPRPTQLLAGSLAGCISITMEMYAERKGWDLSGTEVSVETGYDGPVPRSFDVSVRLPERLDAEQRRRLLTIATKCPVHKVLAGEARVTVAEHLEPA